MTDDGLDRGPDPASPPDSLRSRADFEGALNWSVRHATTARVRRMSWLDVDFSGWPLDSQPLLDALTDWLRLPQRRLVLIAADYASLQRERPRFVAWRRTWAHAIDAWAPSDGVEVSLPTLVIDHHMTCLRIFDKETWRGRLIRDERAVRQWSGEIDALLQRCEPAFPVHQLGL